MSQSAETVMLSKLVLWPVQPIMFGWWQNSSRSVYLVSQGRTGVYILPHKMIVTCEIIYFVYVAWIEKCSVMSFSCSLKMFGWRQNSSRSIYFASRDKTDTAWVIKNVSIGIGYQQRKMKNIGIGPKKSYRSSSRYTSWHCEWNVIVSKTTYSTNHKINQPYCVFHVPNTYWITSCCLTSLNVFLPLLLQPHSEMLCAQWSIHATQLWCFHYHWPWVIACFFTVCVDNHCFLSLHAFVL